VGPIEKAVRTLSRGKERVIIQDLLKGGEEKKELNL